MKEGSDPNPAPIWVANLETQYDQATVMAKCEGVASYPQLGGRLQFNCDGSKC